MTAGELTDGRRAFRIWCRVLWPETLRSKNRGLRARWGGVMFGAFRGSFREIGLR